MTAERPSVADKRRAFHELHRGGCFVLPNPWDIGSARFLQSLGFKALASTSAGFAWSRAYADGAVPRDQVLAHLAEIAAATDVPLNADFQNGFAHEPAALADNVCLAVATGVAGISIEDSTADPAQPLYPLDAAASRMRAARAAIDRSGADTLLVGRAECFLVGRPDLPETIARLKAYAHAGADCLYAPGITTRAQVDAVVRAVAPKPVNVLLGSASELTIDDVAALGVRRVSVGGALARAAWGGLMRAARLLAAQGSVAGFAGAAAGSELDGFFHDDFLHRGAE
jgi:2-methylisocitrate lyase-like PEP mutase family enzyme